MIDEGEFNIPELQRIADRTDDIEVSIDRSHSRVRVRDGVVQCREFPIIVMTSSGDRDFPPAFLRRCLRLEIGQPGLEQLEAIVRAHLGDTALEAGDDIIRQFLHRRTTGELATDQLLNAMFVTMHSDETQAADRQDLADLIMRHLSVPM